MLLAVAGLAWAGNLLIGILVLAVVVYAVSLFLPMLKLPEPINRLVLLIVAVIALVVLYQYMLS